MRKKTSPIFVCSIFISLIFHLCILFNGVSSSEIKYKSLEKNSIQVSVIEKPIKTPKKSVKKKHRIKSSFKKQVISSSDNLKRQELIDEYLSSVQKVIIENLVERKGRKKLSGELTVGLVVLNSGIIRNVSIEKSSGGQHFDLFVTNIIKQIRSLPILPTNDKKILLKIPIRFI